MDTWFFSDPHYGHRNIIKLCQRPWARHYDASDKSDLFATDSARAKDAEEMAEAMIAKHNALVKPDDLVFCLGDFSLAEQHMRQNIRRLNGKIMLVPGNHDLCHPANKKSRKSPEAQVEWAKKYVEAGFAGVLSLAWRLPSDLLLSHMPYKGMEPGEHGDKYAQWRPDDKGGWLLHGHVHTAWKTKGRMINVGVDVWDYAPVHMDQILEIVRKGSQ